MQAPNLFLIVCEPANVWLSGLVHAFSHDKISLPDVMISRHSDKPMQSIDQPILNVEHVSVSRGETPVLHDVCVALRAGTISAVVGRSGAGKSTLLRTLNGLLPPAHGSISMAGVGSLRNASALRRARQRISMVFQDHALIERLSALDNVLLGLADRRHPLSLWPWPAALRERAALSLDEVGLLPRAHARVCELSGGERQRVGVARALIRQPLLLLADEPFAAVDSRLARSLIEQLHKLVTQHGLTSLLVLHQLELARAHADHIIGLAHGRVVFDGPACEFGPEAEERVFGSAPPHEAHTAHARELQA